MKSTDAVRFHGSTEIWITKKKWASVYHFYHRKLSYIQFTEELWLIWIVHIHRANFIGGRFGTPVISIVFMLDRKITKSGYQLCHVCLSVRPSAWQQLGSHWSYFHEVLYLSIFQISVEKINPLNPELNPIWYLLALLGAYHFLHVSRMRVKLLTFRH